MKAIQKWKYFISMVILHSVILSVKCFMSYFGHSTDHEVICVTFYKDIPYDSKFSNSHIAVAKFSSQNFFFNQTARMSKIF